MFMLLRMLEFLVWQTDIHSNFTDAVPDTEEIFDFDFTCPHSILLKKKMDWYVTCKRCQANKYGNLYGACS